MVYNRSKLQLIEGRGTGWKLWNYYVVCAPYSNFLPARRSWRTETRITSLPLPLFKIK